VCFRPCVHPAAGTQQLDADLDNGPTNSRSLRRMFGHSGEPKLKLYRCVLGLIACSWLRLAPATVQRCHEQTAGLCGLGTTFSQHAYCASLEIWRYVPQGFILQFPHNVCDLMAPRDSAAWCPYCEKVWLQLEEKRIPYEITKINMRCYGSKPKEYTDIVSSDFAHYIHLQNSSQGSHVHALACARVVGRLPGGRHALLCEL